MDLKQNKRLFPRVKIKEALHYQVRGEREIRNCVTDDISLGGLRFEDGTFIPPSTQLNMEIHTLSKVLRPIGKVVWSSPFSHTDRFKSGIEFIEFDPAEKKFLSDFISMKRHQL